MAVTGTAKAISTSKLMVSSFVAQAKRANTASVYIGGSGVKNDGTLGIEIAAPTPGVTPDAFEHSTADGAPQINLADWYLNGAAGDGFNIVAVER